MKGFKYNLKECIVEVFILSILIMFLIGIGAYREKRIVSKTVNISEKKVETNKKEENKDYIKWVDFQVTTQALTDAYKYDYESYCTTNKLNWIELLAYLGCRYGGDFKRYKKNDMDTIVNRLNDGEKIENITKDMKYYNYYYNAYNAVLSGMVGEYELDGIKKYGLKAYFPIAKNYPYSHFDDFGNSREYGYKRKHLGHDIFGQVGTPIIAAESGYVEAIGWNQYGGWRLGIRSFDKKRYYYYAHLRRNFPYNKNLKENSIVTAGDVIGYMGRTGYSVNENVNNITTSHLHFGIQLIFDESQKDGANQIWIDCYDICNFLYLNRSETLKDLETKEYNRISNMIDPNVVKYNSNKVKKK